MACLNGKENVNDFANKVVEMFNIYKRENVYSMYVTLGSHDTERALTMLGGDLNKLKLAFLFIFAYPGAPAIYYGDEIGMEGGKDPDCRRAFPWNPADWKADLHPWVQNLISTRKRRVSLRHGEYSRVYVDSSKGIYAFARIIGEEKTLIILNTSNSLCNILIPVQNLWRDGQTLRSLFDNSPFTVMDGNLNITIPASNGVYIGEKY
jgi:glycosidase